VDDWYNHALFGSVFLLGFLIARHASVWEALRRHRWLALALAAASYAGVTWYLGSHSPAHPPSDVLRATMRAVYGLNQWAAIVAALGFARQLAPGDGPVRRYLTQAVFPFYIVHQTAIVVMAHHLKPLALSPVVEGPLLVVATFAACFASFEVIRRVAWMRPLFGMRRDERVTPLLRQPQSA
jgi:hypothetical protein